MSTKIKIPEYLKDKTDGQCIIDVTGNTVRECLGALVRRYPALKGEILDGQGTLHVKWVVFINDKPVIGSDELSAPATDGDVIQLVAMVSGG